jgi:hypothetical protein
MKAVFSSEMMEVTYKTTYCHNPEEQNLNSLSENPNSQICHLFLHIQANQKPQTSGFISASLPAVMEWNSLRHHIPKPLIKNTDIIHKKFLPLQSFEL